MCSGNLADQVDVLKDETFTEVRTQRKSHINDFEDMPAVTERAVMTTVTNRLLSASPYRISGKIKKGLLYDGTAGKPYFKRFSGIEKSTVILSELRWIYGGAEENRTPVRKPIRQPFYTLSEVF